jgi:short-subunit dehydrogenase
LSEDRVVLVTGASSGFGRLTASTLAERGFRVYGASRQLGRARKAEEEGGFEMLQLDVDSDRSVNSCVSALINTTGKIDILVNCAGYTLTGGLEETSIEEAKAQFETNFFGVVRMVNTVLPGMRQRKSGQIINIGSIAGTIPVPFEGFYGAAKAALLAYSEVLRHEVKGFSIKVSIVEPGFFKTNLGSARKQAAAPIEAYRESRTRAIARLMADFEAGQDPRMVSEIICGIIEDPSPRLRYAVGREKRYLFLKKIVPAGRFESSVRRHYELER